MRLFARSRHAWPLLAISLLVGAIPAVDDHVVAFPSIVGGGGTALPLAAVTPVALGILTALGLTARFTHLTEGAARATGWMDAVLIGLITVGTLLTTVLTPSGDLTIVRNAMLAVGIASFGAIVFSPAAGALLTTLAMVASLTYGESAPGSRFVRIFQAPVDSAWPWLLASVVIAAAVLVASTSRAPVLRL